MDQKFEPVTQHGYDLFEVRSALQKEIRRGNERWAAYWALEMIPRYEAYMWKTLKTILNEDIGIANPPLIPIINALESQYATIKDTLAIINAVLLMARSPKTRISCHLSIVIEQSLAQGKNKQEIPDYALDCHTKRGKQKGRTLDDHFRKVGAKLVGEDRTIKDTYEDECYQLLKTQVRFSTKEKEEAPKKKIGNGSLFEAGDGGFPDTY